MNLARALDVVMISRRFVFDGQRSRTGNEQPIHRIFLDVFAIGRYPVTNHDYAIFLTQSGRPAPPFWSDSICSSEQPVVGVTWDEAAAFCVWLSGRSGRQFRLATEAEWEYAARGGVDGALYPWGDEEPWEKPLVGCDPLTGGPAKERQRAEWLRLVSTVGGDDPRVVRGLLRLQLLIAARRTKSQGPALGRQRSSRGGSWRRRSRQSLAARGVSLPPSFRYRDSVFAWRPRSGTRVQNRQAVQNVDRLAEGAEF